jgi:hypothetical protein
MLASPLVILIIVVMNSMHDISDHASRVIHPFTRVLAGPSPQLHVECLNVICVLIKQLGMINHNCIKAMYMY